MRKSKESDELIFADSMTADDLYRESISNKAHKIVQILSEVSIEDRKILDTIYYLDTNDKTNEKRKTLDSVCLPLLNKILDVASWKELHDIFDRYLISYEVSGYQWLEALKAKVKLEVSKTTLKVEDTEDNLKEEQLGKDVEEDMDLVDLVYNEDYFDELFAEANKLADLLKKLSLKDRKVLDNVNKYRTQEEEDIHNSVYKRVMIEIQEIVSFSDLRNILNMYNFKFKTEEGNEWLNCIKILVNIGIKTLEKECENATNLSTNVNIIVKDNISQISPKDEEFNKISTLSDLLDSISNDELKRLDTLVTNPLDLDDITDSLHTQLYTKIQEVISPNELWKIEISFKKSEGNLWLKGLIITMLKNGLSSAELGDYEMRQLLITVLTLPCDMCSNKQFTLIKKFHEIIYLLHDIPFIDRIKLDSLITADINPSNFNDIDDCLHTQLCAKIQRILSLEERHKLGFINFDTIEGRLWFKTVLRLLKEKTSIIATILYRLVDFIIFLIFLILSLHILMKYHIFQDLFYRMLLYFFVGLITTTIIKIKTYYINHCAYL